MAGSVAHIGTGIGSQLNQKAPQWRTCVGDATLDYQPAKTRKQMKCEEKCENEDEVDTSERKAVAKFKLQSSLIFNGKGKLI